MKRKETKHYQISLHDNQEQSQKMLNSSIILRISQYGCSSVPCESKFLALEEEFSSSISSGAFLPLVSGSKKERTEPMRHETQKKTIGLTPIIFPISMVTGALIPPTRADTEHTPVAVLLITVGNISGERIQITVKAAERKNFAKVRKIISDS
mmetsp:Transcript_59018/g.67216  ORF Transcript_59018/g.67216 Transcript_59018/m.67216 type:complete len:153 (-) Transcript_59018:1079-1537(-)